VRRALAAAWLVALAGCPDRTCETGWTVIADRDDGALLSVQGTSEHDVWVAGGGLGLGGAILRHFDGDRWTEIAIDDDRTLWWVTPDGPDRAWAVGEDGLIVHVADGVAEVRDAGVAATLYGVWASAPDDVWIVGEGDLLLHGDGTTFAHSIAPVRDAILFKVWGAAADDVWVGGQRGTLLHWDGQTWTDRSVATPVSILTVAGCGASSVYGVGGQTFFEIHADRVDVAQSEAFRSALDGVTCRASGTYVQVVGNGGLRLLLADEQWEDHSFEDGWDTDYHSVWSSPEGNTWAAGGNFNDPAPTRRRGVLTHDGCPHPPGF
jgi:hypothetical protein